MKKETDPTPRPVSSILHSNYGLSVTGAYLSALSCSFKASNGSSLLDIAIFKRFWLNPDMSLTPYLFCWIGNALVLEFTFQKMTPGSSRPWAFHSAPTLSKRVSSSEPLNLVQLSQT